MQENLDQRINDILASTNGSQRAKPRADLLAKIENQTYNKKATIIPLRRLRLVAAALLLFINGLAINGYLNQEVNQAEYADRSLIMDYKLYE